MSLMRDGQIQPPPCRGQHKGGGPTSYRIQDARELFAVLNLKNGDKVVDIGCGRGEYSLKAAEIVGSEGKVYALDYWKSYTDRLKQEAQDLGLHNITPLEADVRKRLPVEDNFATTCLLFTILHATTLDILKLGLGMELQRILQPEGRVAILELKKEETPFGPPLKQRLTAGQVMEAFASWKFHPVSITDLGYTNLIIVEKQK